MSDGNQAWKVDRTVTAGNLLTLILMLASLFVWGNALDKDVATNKNDIQQLEKLQDRNWELNQKSVQEMKNQLDRISDKLDRLLTQKK